VGAGVGGLVVDPHAPDRLDVFAHDRGALGRRKPAILELVDVPSRADAEQRAPAGQQVEGCDGLRGAQRVVLRDEQDAGADLQGTRGEGCRGERDERVERARVLPRELP
jgi:hypothetical protein